MISEPMDVLIQHPVRKTKKQKSIFRSDIVEYAQTLGYRATVEHKGMCDNVLIGDPKTAKYLITAHYDTPAVLPIPNLITPCSCLLFVLYQLLVTIVLLLPFVLVLILLSVITENNDLAFSLSYILLWVELLLVYAGPANKNNANDNTSGVVTVLETAKSLPEELRERVCFVLFDLEEWGMVGSGAYRKMHKKESNEQIVLNLDCVGDGDNILFFPTGKLKRNKKMMTWLKNSSADFDEKTLSVRHKGFSVYPSDQAHFPYGVGIAAFRRNWLGLYLSRIHTHRDTVLEEKNVSILRTALTELVRSDAMK